MRILVAPQEFKGSLSAKEATLAIAKGVAVALPGARVEMLPLSDGGPGLVDVILAAKGGRHVEADCHDPLMRPMRGGFGITSAGAAVIEMAAASGLVLLKPEERDPLAATTFGTGELIAIALDEGCGEIIVGVGGSATVDAGAGALTALGARLVDATGALLPPGGGGLRSLARIDLSGLDARLAGTRVRVASDVRNPLVGADGAASMFGPQKGASPEGVVVLEEALRQFATVALRDCGIDVATIPGTGAAGGLGAGLMLCGAVIEPGFELVAEACDLEARIAAVDAVITGEGRLDEQTPYGKTAWGVAEMARSLGRRVGVVAGYVDASFSGQASFDAIEQARPEQMPVEQAMASGAVFVQAAAMRIAARLAGDGT